MKITHSFRLGAAVIVAASTLVVSGADSPKKLPTVGTKLQQERPGETLEQRATRHEQEFTEAKTKMGELEKDLPLLTAPGWEAKEKTFRTELAKLQDNPAFKRQASSKTRLEPGKRLAAKTKDQFQTERRDADLDFMRRQADKALEAHPELRDYVEQRFQWHLRLFAVMGKYPGNPKVLELAQRRLEGPPEVRPDK